jgi:ABC-2 type transport system ATP-binding protein
MLKVLTPPEERAEAPGAGAAPAILLDDVSFAYGERTALDGVSLRVPAGSIFGLLGPNGSGKSTLLSLLIGRRAATRGAVTVLGQPPSAALRQRIAIVFQEPSLDPHMTVSETMALQARLFGLRRDEGARGTARLLDRVGLADRASSATATLSGGMKRRLELARALLPSPDVVLLDEPTLALDPDSRLALWQHLVEASAAGCTLLLATNDVYEAERYCQTVALLEEGRVIAEGAPSELKRELRREAVRIDWRHDPGAETTAMETWPGVGHVRLAGHTTHVTTDDASAFLARLFETSGRDVVGVHIEQSTLEDVYFQLVGHGIVAGEAR